MSKLLNQIHSPKDLRRLSKEQLPLLAQELRDFIINIVAVKEGHLGASLGVVELTIALHYLFDTPNDELIWDVGHQAYGHKILTGRKDVFHTNRQLGGISGFPNREESEYDSFGVGHSSTSISAALGIALASKIKGNTNKHHIAVIGDASIASGMAFEGLNHAGVTDANVLIVLNDNTIGIDPAVGALKDYLTKVKKDISLVENNFFTALKLNYSGPIDGHDLPKLLEELERLKKIKGPKLLHVITTKGKGLKRAEENQVTYHAPGRFDAKTGDLIPKKKSEFTKFQDVFGDTLVELAKDNPKIVAITPAMLTGSSLTKMMKEFSERTFDVGIAEQHAVTLAAGMATQGMIPFCNIYSTFLQRAYDQIIHDVALQKLPVVFCLDRAGIVGQDGATHHGVFDIAYLRLIPNLTIFAPKDEVDLRNMLFTVQQEKLNGPLAIRYPRGRGQLLEWKLPFEKIEFGKGICLQEGEDIAVLSLGTIFLNVSKAIQGNNIAHYDFRFAKPIDEVLLHTIFHSFKDIVTVEDGTVVGGFGSAVSEFLSKHKYKNNLHILGVKDQFIGQGTVEELQQQTQLDVSSLSGFFNRLANS